MADSAQDQVQIPLSTSPLLRLPRELLQHIFDEAYEEEQPPSLLCHTLAPMVIRARWQNIDLLGCIALKRFGVKATRTPSILRAVQSLSLCDSSHAAMYIYRGPFRDGDPSVLQHAGLASVFANLTSLRSLEVTAEWSIVRYVMEGIRRIGAVPNLRVLRLASTFEEWEEPLYPGYWTFLPHCTALTDLELEIWSGWSNAAVPPSSLPSPLPSVRSVVSLNILHFGWKCSAAAAFASLFPNITSLFLHTSGEVTHVLTDILSSLTHPEKVLVLSVDDSCHDTTISNHLPSFRCVEDLRITGCDSRTPALFNAIRRLPNLRALEFDGETEVEAAELVRLLEGTGKHPCLQLLDLNHFDVHDGPSVGQYGAFFDAERKEWTPHAYGWSTGYFTEEFPPECMWELVEIGHRNGVEVRGSMLEAMKVQKAFEAEEKLVAERWGNAPPPFSPGEMEYYTQKRT